MDFRTLGPFEVLDADDLVAVPAASNEPCLPCWRPGSMRVVPADRLADDLWDGDPPHAASSVLYSYVSKLRRALGGVTARWSPGLPATCWTWPPPMSTPTGSKPSSVRSSTRLTPRRPGSRPTCPRRSRCGGARRSPISPGPLGRRRGRPPGRGAAPAIERRLDAELALGHHKAVVAEVEPLVAAYPLRERLCGQLMLGLYRSGRQAERCGPSRDCHLVDAGHHPQP